MKKDNRILTVYSSSGLNYKETPAIVMKGQWLKDYGFEIGAKYAVESKKGKIVISIIEEK